MLLSFCRVTAKDKVKLYRLLVCTRHAPGGFKIVHVAVVGQYF